MVYVSPISAAELVLDRGLCKHPLQLGLDALSLQPRLVIIYKTASHMSTRSKVKTI